MLVHLHVKNLALIEETEVEFGPGLNILTGETGAGKSILLGSIQLILGGKTSRSMIRENASYALVELLFQVENTKARESLAALDIYPEDGQVLMSRKIMDGRSINKINGETSTVSQMKAAAAALDAMKWPEILGCIAGDDTIMCVVKTSEQASGVVQKLSGILSRNK